SILSRSSVRSAWIVKNDDYPALYQDADSASLKSQRHFFFALGSSLILLVLAALISVVNYHAVWLASLQALLLSISLALTVYLALSQPQRTWYGTRALAESVKTITWRFMMNAEPYDQKIVDARNNFISTLQKLITDNPYTKHVTAWSDAPQITPYMTRVRRMSLVSRKDVYDKDRIREQLKWYKGKAKWNDLRSSNWFWLMAGLQAIAVICAIARIWFYETPLWPTDVLVTATSAVLAWSQAKRFQELSASYNLTAHEIASLHSKLPDLRTVQQFSLFVGDAENAFSREHTQWSARRDVL
ncbi:MAG: DUF4231 domain-containing protein, partial [Methyloceanibacter sp.]